MSRFSIKSQVFVIVCVLIVLSLVIVGAAFFSMSSIRKSTEEIDTTAHRLNEMCNVRSIMQTVATNIREVVLAQGEDRKKELETEINREVAELDKEMAAIGTTDGKK